MSWRRRVIILLLILLLLLFWSWWLWWSIFPLAGWGRTRRRRVLLVHVLLILWWGYFLLPMFTIQTCRLGIVVWVLVVSLLRSRHVCLLREVGSRYGPRFACVALLSCEVKRYVI